ncbi:hypothetical protein Dimus_012521 [Dionaea muscipula]
MQIIDLGQNRFNDTFPHWLGALPSLQVLVLRSNNFYGSFGSSNETGVFPQLQILDLSNNSFNGVLPRDLIQSLKAIIVVVADKKTTAYLGFSYSFKRITCNPRTGHVVGLNIEGYGLTGSYIESNSSLFCLHHLERLDLSDDTFADFTQLHWTSPLEYLYAYDCNYMAPLDQPNDMACSRITYCGEQGAPETPSASSTRIFEWDNVLMGYGFGIVFGLVRGSYMFLLGRPRWALRSGILLDRMQKEA